jgi:hypothetical protein
VTPESTHSAVLRLLDVDTGEESAPIQVPTRDAFNGVRWSQGDTLILSDARGNARFSLSEGRVFDRGPDSVFIINVNTPGWKVFNDLTAIPRGIYASPVGGGPARFVCPPVGNSRWSGVPDRSFAYCWPNSLGFSRIFFPSGRFEPVPHVPPDIRGGTAFAANRDGRVIVWMEPHDAAKLVLVENLHR